MTNDWSGSQTTVAVVSFAPKGWDNLAQGNALGTREATVTFFRALKGHHNNAWGAPSGHGREKRVGSHRRPQGVALG